jgi:hypothetical protein
MRKPSPDDLAAKDNAQCENLQSRTSCCGDDDEVEVIELNRLIEQKGGRTARTPVPEKPKAGALAEG